ncbi:TadE family type IV pilus minor pilin [Georgenia sp. Z1491]
MTTHAQPGAGHHARPPAAPRRTDEAGFRRTGRSSRHRAAGAASHRPGPDERGMVTAELATVLPAVALVLLLVLSAIATGAAHIRATDAAQAGARAAAAGESSQVVVDHAQRLAPDDANVTVAQDDGLVVVTVVAPYPGPLSLVGGRVIASASAVPEEALVGEGSP